MPEMGWQVVVIETAALRHQAEVQARIRQYQQEEQKPHRPLLPCIFNITY